MAHETELKLALPESAQRSFLRHPMLMQAVDKSCSRLINLYYDTPQLELRQRGVCLRLRADGQHWLQTIKCRGDASGGLSRRPEWETPYSGRFDFAVVDDDDLRRWLQRPRLKTAITPIFETNFERRLWLFAPAPQQRFALMLDRGWIAAAGRRETICELEIELIEGDAALLLEQATRLAADIATAPAMLSKADRGYLLFANRSLQPVKATPVACDRDEAPLVAFRRIAFACLDHMQHNHPGAISSDDPEYIHQMRVATRRLRAALRLFAPLLPPDFTAPLLPDLRRLMSVLGHARDLDVLQAEIAEPVLLALPDEPRLAALVGVITEQRFGARRTAMRFLNSPQYGAMILRVMLALQHLPSQDATATPCLGDFSARRLRRLRKNTLACAARATANDPVSLHTLRIAIKRLRYGLEFFQSLLKARPLRRNLDHLEALQDTLGQINDLANAGALLMACAGNDPNLRESVTLIGGWHGLRHQALLRSAPKQLRRLGDLKVARLR